MNWSYFFKASFLPICIEPLIEIFWTTEDIGEQKIQQSPQFMKIVLQWSSSEK